MTNDLPRLRLAEELGDVDEYGLQQTVAFVGIIAQPLSVLVELFYPDLLRAFA